MYTQITEHVDRIEQAPREMSSLFNGERKMVYGFIDNCTQAVLHAHNGDQEIETRYCYATLPFLALFLVTLTYRFTRVSTSELCFTKGNLLHTLVAKALISQFKDGNYDANKARHNHEMRKVQQDIIDLSKKYSIITEFTSFGTACTIVQGLSYQCIDAMDPLVAIEKREPGEEHKEGPSIEQLVAREEVDQLGYISWQETTGDFTATPGKTSINENITTIRTTIDEERERVVYFQAVVGVSDDKLPGKPIVLGLSENKLTLFDPEDLHILVRLLACWPPFR